MNDLNEGAVKSVVLGLRPVLFPTGSTLLRNGEKVKQIGVLASGSAHWEVPCQSSTLCGTIRRGDWFGLVEVLSESPSIKLLLCLEPVTCYVQESEDFLTMLQHHEKLRDFFYRLAFGHIKHVFRGMGSNPSNRIVSLRREHWKIPRNLEKSILYLEQNYMQPITLEQVAKANGMSKYHFSRVFKSETSLTFSEYLNKRRIEAAKLLMLEQKMNVSEACFAVGFNNVSYFTRIFKRLMGVAPSYYMKAERKLLGSRNQKAG